MRNIAVIGLGRFGAALATELHAFDGVDVLAIDIDEEATKAVESKVTAVRCIDARNSRALEVAGVADVDLAIVAIGENFVAAQECVLALKEDLGLGQVLARAQTEDRREILLKVGANEVLSPEEESAKRVAGRLTHPLTADSVDLGDGLELMTLTAPSSFEGKTLAEIGAEMPLKLLVIGVIRADGGRGAHAGDIPPSGATRIEEGDRLKVLGRRDDVRRLAISARG